MRKGFGKKSMTMQLYYLDIQIQKLYFLRVVGLTWADIDGELTNLTCKFFLNTYIHTYIYKTL